MRYLVVVVAAAALVTAGVAVAAGVGFSDLSVTEQVEYANQLVLKGDSILSLHTAWREDQAKAAANGMSAEFQAEMAAKYAENLAAAAEIEVTPATARAAVAAREVAALMQDSEPSE